jgi:hypothetical protein
LKSLNLVANPIEVLECSTCGERYYDRKTRRYLEEIDQKLHDGKAVMQDIGKVKILAA